MIWMRRKVSMITIKTREELSIILLRVAISIIIASHGWHRLITGGYEPFGIWLDSQGIPFGLAIAWSVTLIEVAGSPVLALGKKYPTCVLFT
jgi:putative oxidoreductase